MQNTYSVAEQRLARLLSATTLTTDRLTGDRSKVDLIFPDSTAQDRLYRIVGE